MNLNDAIVYLDSSIRHNTPVHKDFLVAIKKLLEEYRDDCIKDKDFSSNERIADSNGI